MTDTENGQVFDLNDALSSAYDTITAPETEESSPKDEPAPAEPKGEAEEQEQAPDQRSGSEPKPAIEQPLTPPSRWSAEDKERFTALPREAQEIVLEREGDVEKHLTQKSQEVAEQRKKYEALEQVLEPRRQELVRNYGSEAVAVNQLFQLSEYAGSDPAGFIKWFAQQRGIDISTLLPDAANNRFLSDEDIDPAVQEARQRLQSIEQKLALQEQTQKQATLNSVREEIVSFQEAKDEAGNLKYPHFENVRPEMATFMQNGTCKTLAEAYEKAIWANPSTREKVLAEREKSAEAKRLDAAKQAAAKATKATGVQIKPKGSVTTGREKGDWQSDLSTLYDQIAGSV